MARTLKKRVHTHLFRTKVAFEILTSEQGYMKDLVCTLPSFPPLSFLPTRFFLIYSVAGYSQRVLCAHVCPISSGAASNSVQQYKRSLFFLPSLFSSISSRSSSHSPLIVNYRNHLCAYNVYWFDRKQVEAMGLRCVHCEGGSTCGNYLSTLSSLFVDLFLSPFLPLRYSYLLLILILVG